MANRYWVGGTADWDATAGLKWALTSAGAGGQAVPTAADDVFFDAASGAGITTIAAAATCLSLNCTGYTGTLAGASTLAVTGSLTLVAGMTYSHTGTITFNATATGKTVATGGKTMPALTFDGVGGGWTLSDACNAGTSAITLTNGTLNTNGQTVTCGNFNFSNANIRTLTLGASTINCSGGWTGTTTTNLTFSGASSTIKVTGTNTFAGGGLTYGTVSFDSTGTTTVTGANTFSTITRGAAIAAGTVTFPAETTQTLTTWSLDGSSGNILTLNSSTSGTLATLSKASGTVTGAYLILTDINVTGGAHWLFGTAQYSTRVQGWKVSIVPGPRFMPRFYPRRK